MKKPIIEWFDILDDSVQSLAIANITPNIHHVERESLYEALCGAFVWANTDEGVEFWRDVADGIERSESCL